MKNKATLAVVLLLSFVVFVSGCIGAGENGSESEDTSPTGNAIRDLEDNPEKVVVYFFWGDGCPHCEHEKPFLEELEQKYPELEVKSFETWKNPDNVKIFQEVAQAYGIQARGVPTTFIGDFEPIVGYGSDETTGADIENKIKQCIANDCVNPADKIS